MSILPLSAENSKQYEKIMYTKIEGENCAKLLIEIGRWFTEFLSNPPVSLQIALCSIFMAARRNYRFRDKNATQAICREDCLRRLFWIADCEINRWNTSRLPNAIGWAVHACYGNPCVPWSLVSRYADINTSNNRFVSIISWYSVSIIL